VESAPRSPDLNPLDFALWGYLKEKVYSVKIQNIHQLQQRITDACAPVDPDVLRRIQRNMVFRLQVSESWRWSCSADSVKE
jgi:hypothetical protein